MTEKQLAIAVLASTGRSNSRSTMGSPPRGARMWTGTYPSPSGRMVTHCPSWPTGAVSDLIDVAAFRAAMKRAGLNRRAS